RDTAPNGGREYLRRLEAHMQSIGLGRVATIIGRYWAMDRDKRWERTARAYNLYTRGEGERAESAAEAIQRSYDAGVTDEFVEPFVIVSDDKEPRTIRDDDSVIFFNFRADRARQITRAFTDDAFTGFERNPRPRVHYTCMSRYDESFTLPVVFAPESREDILVDTASGAGKKTLRIAETEKYAHVTYFFNGGEEIPFNGETRLLIPSPKVATYDLQPEMSAREVCDTLIREIRGDQHDYLVCNFANPDMVGHTGVLEAAIKAVETVDACVGRVLEAIDPARHMAIVTADHGNCELMVDPVTGGPHTAHTTSPVPCILVDRDYRGELIADGSLRDLAPTILNYMGVPRPSEMTGRDLRVKPGA
ncbi:MAG TPA: 2,3-bisphosphoglycerate-independent phosphoglycerate mutase, partial [Candidatus Krumholzibacteria bacterium]|nr:2,3-bisphosphoglycerate-independent phosphoglycerate mutase [Candidatus Krumholzibacteria bacterium]